MSSEMYNTLIEFYQQYIVLIWIVNIICGILAYVMVGFAVQGFYTKWGKEYMDSNEGPGPFLGCFWFIGLPIIWSIWICQKCYSAGEDFATVKKPKTDEKINIKETWPCEILIGEKEVAPGTSVVSKPATTCCSERLLVVLAILIVLLSLVLITGH